jgi:nucleolin
VLRSKSQSAFTPSVFRRFNSDEASQEKSSIESADGEHGSIRSAIDSASDSASTYASEATEKVTEAAEYARDSVAEAAAGAAAAVGGYAPRDYQRNDNRQPYNGGRSNGNGNGRSFGGDRGGYGGDRGRAPQSFDRGSPPDRILTPTNSVYVGNLLFDVADSDLRREFEQFGDIKSVIIATDARGLSKG